MHGKMLQIHTNVGHVVNHTDADHVLDHTDVDPVQDRTVLRVIGDVDMRTVGTLRDAVVRAIDGGARQVVVDLRGTAFICARGLSCLMVASRRAEDRGQTLYVVAGQPAIVRPLEVTGLAAHVRLRADVEDVPLPGEDGVPLCARDR